MTESIGTPERTTSGLVALLCTPIALGWWLQVVLTAGEIVGKSDADNKFVFFWFLLGVVSLVFWIIWRMILRAHMEGSAKVVLSFIIYPGLGIGVTAVLSFVVSLLIVAG